MENNIVIIHAGLAALSVLYLLIRLFISFFGMFDSEFQQVLRRRLRTPDWILIALISTTGAYPILVLGTIELYHFLKVAILGLVIWITRFNQSINLTGATALAILFIGFAGYMSFVDTPKFQADNSKFEKKHDDLAELSKIQKGKVIFTTLCIQCHGEDGRLQRFQAADLSKSKMSLAEKIRMIETGSPFTVMRSFKNELSPSDIEAVALYIMQLDTAAVDRSSEPLKRIQQ